MLTILYVYLVDNVYTTLFYVVVFSLSDIALNLLKSDTLYFVLCTLLMLFEILNQRLDEHSNYTFVKTPTYMYCLWDIPC